MRKLTRALSRASFVALASVMAVTAATAAPIGFSGSVAAAAPGANNAMDLDIQLLVDPLTFALDVGQSTTINLFKIWNTTTSFKNSGVQNEDIDVDFGFDSPEAFTGGLTGSVRGNVVKQGTGRNASFVFSSGAVDFSSTPLRLVFGANNSGLLNITLSDVTFGTGLANAGTVMGTFTLASAPTVPVVENPGGNGGGNPVNVPEPGALGLFGLGLVAVSLRKRRAL